jgi:hypothetical protein
MTTLAKFMCVSMELIADLNVNNYSVTGQQERARLELEKIVALFSSKALPAYCARVLIDSPEKPSSKWSLGNQLLMLLNGTSDARGFEQWKLVGRYVKKGSRAFHILGPVLVQAKDEGETNEGEKEEEPQRLLVGFRAIPVFRFEDTDGEPLPKYEPRTVPPLAHLAKKWGLTIEYERLGRANGAYSLEENKIFLATENPGTFFHELSHAAHAKIEKLKGGQDPEQEATAQLSSAVLCRIFGFDDDSYTFHYIANYSGEKSPRAVGQMCLRVLGRVQSVVNLILEETEGT